MTENFKVFALRLLDRFDEYPSVPQLLYRYSKSISVEWVGQTKFTVLHGAAILGAMEIFAAVVEMKEWDINAGDWLGSTARS